MDYDEDPNYLDLEDIQVNIKSVPIKFLLDIPNLEFLTSGSRDEVVPGYETQLPFWMAKVLYTHSMIDIELPRQYNQASREVIEADPDVVDLHRMGPNFYQLGRLLLSLRREKGNNLPAFLEDGQRNKFRREEGEMMDERLEIATCLINTFHHRRKMILEHSINPLKIESTRAKQFEQRLDDLEKKLYRYGDRQLNDWIKWNDRNSDRVTSSEIAIRVSKRRKLDQQD